MPEEDRLVRFVSIARASELLGISAQTIRNLIERKVMSKFRVPTTRCVMVDLLEIEKKIEAEKV